MQRDFLEPGGFGARREQAAQIAISLSPVLA
jgi:hypothetical protein